MKKILEILKNKTHIIILICILLIIEAYYELTLPAYTATIVNNGIQYGNINLIWNTGIEMMEAITIAIIATILLSILSSRLSSSFARDLREKVYKKVLKLSNKDLNKFTKGSLITRSTNDINQVQNVLEMTFRTLLFAPILGIGGIIKAAEIGSNLWWILLITFIIVISIIYLIMHKVIPSFKKMQETLDNINRISREILIGIPVIKAFLKKEYEEERFNKENTKFKEINLRVYRLMLFLIPAMSLIMNLMIILILYAGSIEALQGHLLTGDIIAFIQYSTQIVSSFIMIGGFIAMLPRVFVSINRIEEILNTEIKIKDGKQTLENTNTIEFKNVYYKYPGAEKDTLKNINFKLEKGKTTAIIGGTGSGKTTILNLIPRLEDVSKGEILINNTNIKNLKLKNLREKIGYTPQKAHLFTGNIESNLKIGKTNAKKEEIEETIEKTESKDFIESITDTVQQNGSNFSGGQKQRITIGRTLIGKHEYYLFDDCFSALDTQTEAKIKKELKKLKNKTILIVSQRISTIKDADEIIVLEDGEIINKGTHQELLEKSPFYKEIAQTQMDVIQ